MKQKERILKIMLDNPQKKVWYAKDFQKGENFIGYEASARMSEIANMFPDIVEVGKDGRYRTLSVNWLQVEKIKEMKAILEELEYAKEN